MIHIFRRGLHSLVALFVLLLLVFFLARLTGDPTNLYLPLEAPLAVREAFAEQHGFNDPLYQQFFSYLGNLVRLDFGQSLFQGRPAMDAALQAFPVTLALASVTMVLAVVLAILIGSLAAYRPGKLFDRLASMLTILSASAPDFWIALVAILVLSVQLDLLPTSGMGTIWHWLLPVGVLLIRPLGLLAQVARAEMIDALNANFVKTARAKGASKKRVVFIHSLRNTLPSIVTVAGDQTVSMINGAVIVETIFGWPGIGNLMIGAIIQRDFAVVQACILVTAIAIFVMNILIDLIHTRLDPRVRLR